MRMVAFSDYHYYAITIFNKVNLVPSNILYLRPLPSVSGDIFLKI